MKNGSYTRLLTSLAARLNTRPATGRVAETTKVKEITMFSKPTMRQLAVFCIFLIFYPGRVLGQQPTTPLPGMPPGTTNGGGVTKSGKKYDYRKVEPDKITYFHVLRTREEIDAYLKLQASIPNPDPGMVELANMPWHIMSTPWRTDPVTIKGGPLSGVPPTPTQMEELLAALPRLGLSEAGQREFAEKLAKGQCIERSFLDPARFVSMVNGTSVNQKLEVPAELAKGTKSCEFFLESDSLVLNLVYICGNYGFVFMEVWWEANPGTPEILTPTTLTCTITPAEATLSSPSESAVFNLTVTPPQKQEDMVIEWFRQTLSGTPAPLTRDVMRAEVPGSFLERSDVWVPIKSRVTVGRATAECESRMIVRSPSMRIPTPLPPKPGCASATLDKKSVTDRKTEVTITGDFTNLPAGVRFIPVVAVRQGNDEIEIARGKRDTKSVRFAVGRIPGLDLSNRADYQLSISLVNEATGEVVARCGGSLDTQLTFAPPAPPVVEEKCPECKIRAVSKDGKVTETSTLTLVADIIPAGVTITNSKFTARIPGKKDLVEFEKSGDNMTDIQPDMFPRDAKGKLVPAKYQIFYTAEYMKANGQICKISCFIEIPVGEKGWNKAWLLLLGLIGLAFLGGGKKKTATAAATSNCTPADVTAGKAGCY